MKLAKSAIIGLGIFLSCSQANSASPPRRSVRDTQARLNLICAGKAAGSDIQFQDSEGDDYNFVGRKGVVLVYRQAIPESNDWAAMDTFVFSAASGKRVHFSRAVSYAGHLFAYVLMIDANGRKTDNSAALPEGQYLTDVDIFVDLKQACRIKPVKAG